MSSSSPKQTHSTGNPYESQFGYNRAVRKGPYVFVAGSTSLDPNPPHSILYPGDAAAQTKQCVQTSISAIEALGGTRDSICRVRMFVARKEDCDAVGMAMKATLGGIGVVMTMVVLGLGGGFVRDEMRVEIEVDAVV